MAGQPWYITVVQTLGLPTALVFFYLFQSAGLFEEVRRSGDDLELLFAAEQSERPPVQLDDLEVVSADDE